MEDALALDISPQYKMLLSAVLILVVMEDALALAPLLMLVQNLLLS